MVRRLLLQALLEDLLGSDNVYFQPPPSIRMKYPAIVYNRDDAVSQFANNQMYRYTKRYQVTVIDMDPDSEIPNKVATLPMCSHSRNFRADDLNHDIFNVYF